MFYNAHLVIFMLCAYFIIKEVKIKIIFIYEDSTIGIRINR